MTRFLQDKKDKFDEAATRLQMEIYVADVFYQNSCYIKLVIKKKVTVNKEEQMENLQNDKSEEFFLSLKKRVIHQKEVFLLSDLLDDIKRLSTVFSLINAHSLLNAPLQ